MYCRKLHFKFSVSFISIGEQIEKLYQFKNYLDNRQIMGRVACISMFKFKIVDSINTLSDIYARYIEATDRNHRSTNCQVSNLISLELI